MAITLKSKKNLLDMIPCRNARLGWEQDAEGLVHVIIPRNGLADRLVRRLVRRPETLRVDLDRFGSFVWLAIDGREDICRIGERVRSEFGEEAEPLYERLAAFMNLMKNNRLIYFDGGK